MSCFETQSPQDFVATARATGLVAGYYTLATSSFPLPDISPAIAKKLQRYPLVSAVRIGRLGVAGPARGDLLIVSLLTLQCFATLNSNRTAAFSIAQEFGGC